jgi:hypothetical protein
LSYVTNSNTIPLGSIAKFMLEILMEGQKFCGHAQKTFTQPPKGAMTVSLSLPLKGQCAGQLAYPLPREQNILAGGAINKLLEDKKFAG